MKYAICNEVYIDWEWPAVCQHARSCGYQGIEIAPFTLGESVESIGSEQRLAIRRTAEDQGLQIVGLHWLLAGTEGLHLTHPDPAIRDRTVRYLRQLVQLCHDLGGDVMVFGSPAQRNLLPGVTEEQGTAFALDVFRNLVTTLEELDVTLAVEPLGPEEGNFLLTADQVIQLCRQIDSPSIRLQLDVKAMASEPRSIPEIIAESCDWLAHFHANDPNRRGPGMGDVDFGPIVQALREIDYDGWISVETFDATPGIEALTRGSLDYLRSIAGGV